MAGIVLALAGLTCGDGGPGTRAATAPVAVSMMHGAWEGRWGQPPTWGHADLRGDVLRIVNVTAERVVTYRVRLQGPGKLEIKYTEGPLRFPGIYKTTDSRLLICIGEPRPTSFKCGYGSLLITLRPAAPSKP